MAGSTIDRLGTRMSILQSPDAPERRIDIGIVAAEPVAEAPAQQLLRGGGRRSLHDPVLSVEEVGGIDRVGRHWLKSLKAAEGRRGPFPPVPDEVVDSPRAGARGKGADGYGVGPPEVEVAAGLVRSVLSPGVGELLAG